MNIMNKNSNSNQNIDNTIISGSESIVQELSEYQKISQDKNKQQSLITRFNHTLHRNYELTSAFNKDKYKELFDRYFIEGYSSLAIKDAYDQELEDDTNLDLWEYARFLDSNLDDFLNGNLYSSRKKDRYYIKQSLGYVANIIYWNKLCVFELDSLIEKIKEIDSIVESKICKDTISKFLKQQGYVNVQQKLNNKRHNVYKLASLIKPQNKKVKHSC